MYRWLLRANINSFFTQVDLIECGDRISTNQWHRFSASPISSCHCWAPTIFVSLYQTGMPCCRNYFATFDANSRSLLEWERKISCGRMAVLRVLRLKPLQREFVRSAVCRHPDFPFPVVLPSAVPKESRGIPSWEFCLVARSGPESVCS